MKIIFHTRQSMEFGNHFKNGARPAKPTEQEKIKISTKTDGSMVYNRHNL
jgi:hypothetical protein